MSYEVGILSQPPGSVHASAFISAWQALIWLHKSSSCGKIMNWAAVGSTGGQTTRVYEGSDGPRPTSPYPSHGITKQSPCLQIDWCLSVCLSIYLDIFLPPVCVYVYVCVCTCTYTYVYIFNGKEIHVFLCQMVLLLLLFWNKGWLCSPNWSETQASLASTSCVLELPECPTTPDAVRVFHSLEIFQEIT
jgi:hypothetical protein